MVDTIGNLDKSVQYYHMLEEQLRQYREDLENMRNRIDGVDDLTKFKAVNYEGSHKCVLAMKANLNFLYIGGVKMSTQNCES